MATAAYTIEVDFDRDETFGHASADITQYVMELSWSNGMKRGEDFYANPSGLTVTLDNSGGDFNLQDSGATFFGLLKVGLLVRLTATFAATPYNLYLNGKIRELPRMPDQTFSAEQVHFQCTDLMVEFNKTEVIPPLETETTVDVILQNILDLGVVILPYTKSAWVLDNNTLGTNDSTLLMDTSELYTLATGIEVFPFAGDYNETEQEKKLGAYLKELIQTEGGRFWFDTRTGKFVLDNRHVDINEATEFTITAADYLGGQYVQAAVFNDIELTYVPREIGAAEATIWQTTSETIVRPGESKTLSVRFSDPDTKRRIAASIVIPPARDTDWTARTAADGGGDPDNSAEVNVLFDGNASGGRLSVINGNPSKRRYFPSIKIRGTPLYSDKRETVVTADPISIVDFDRSKVPLKYTLISEFDNAFNRATWYLNRHKDPRNIYESIQFIANKTDTMMTNALTYGVGSRVRIQNADRNHDTNYVIVGENHQVTFGGEGTHTVTWILETLALWGYWQLGTAGETELGDTTRLAL